VAKAEETQGKEGRDRLASKNPFQNKNHPLKQPLSKLLRHLLMLLQYKYGITNLKKGKHPIPLLYSLKKNKKQQNPNIHTFLSGQEVTSSQQEIGQSHINNIKSTKKMYITKSESSWERYVRPQGFALWGIDKVC
jgi:hypothetical protein